MDLEVLHYTLVWDLLTAETFIARISDDGQTLP